MEANRRVSKHSTVDDLLRKRGESEKFGVEAKNGKPRIFRKGEELNVKKPTEIYINEGELKKAANDYFSKLKKCKLLKTDNMALRVGNGRKAKTRNPGMSDHHLCIRGLFVAIEAKMPGKSLDTDQIKYKNQVESALGIFIEYHSIFELETELLKHKLISRRVFVN
jgi:hypothetical protein